MKRFFFAALLALAGCATTPELPSTPSQKTAHRVEESADGFMITAGVSRYQFVPDEKAVEAAGKIELINMAHQLARERGREIERINNDDLFGSTSRNGLTGVTTWTGSAHARYAPPR